MKKHPDSQRISAYLDGELLSAELRQMEEHLSSCDACSALVQDLRQIRAAARGLPDAFPDRDLWPGIAEAIAGETALDPDVIRLHPTVSRLDSRSFRRKIHLTLPQAAAAGLVLALVSGVAGTRLGTRLGAESGFEAPGETAAVVQGAEASWVGLVGEARPDLASTAREVARMEVVLDQYRAELDPVTAQVLEKSLLVIDRAIEESVLALRADPSNRFLGSNLERAILAKSRYLQDATQFIVPVT